MKKKILLLAAMALVLMSCGQDDKQQKEAKATAPAAKVAKAENTATTVNLAKKRGSTLNLETTGKFEGKFNPSLSSTTYDSTVNSYIFETLVSYGNDFIFKPGDLTESFEYNADKMQYIFHLKKGIKFSDGQELTSDDVKFTFSLVARPEYTGRGSFSASSIKGFKDVESGKTRDLSGIETPDKYTVIFNMAEANARSLNSFVSRILPRHYYEYANKEEYKTKFLTKTEHPIGSGPYKLTEYKPGEYVVLDRFKDYHQGTSDVQKIVIKVVPTDSLSASLAKGDLDVSSIGGRKNKEKEIAGATGIVDFQITPPSSYSYIGFNLRKPSLQDKPLRQALAYGLNRQLYADKVLEGYAKVVNQPLVPQHWASSKEVNPYAYNPEKAKEILEKDGWKVGDDGFRYKDGKKLSLSLETSSSTGASSTGKTWLALIKQNWKAIGVDVEIKLTDFNAMVKDLDSKTPQFDLVMLGWSTIADPDQTGMFGTGGANNFVGYSNANVDKWSKEGLAEMDQSKRAVIYNKIMKQLNDDLPYIFTTSSTGVVGINKRVKGLDYENDMGVLDAVAVDGLKLEK